MRQPENICGGISISFCFNQFAGQTQKYEIVWKGVGTQFEKSRRLREFTEKSDAIITKIQEEEAKPTALHQPSWNAEREGLIGRMVW